MSLARKGLLLSIATYSTLIVGIAQAMILSRALGPAGVGELSLYRQTFLVALQLLSLGLPMAMIRLINNKAIAPIQAKAYFSKIGLGLSLVASGLVCLLLWIGSERLFPAVVPLIFLGGTIFIITVSLRAVLYNYCAAMLWARQLAAISFLPAALLLCVYACQWGFFQITVTTAVISEAMTLGLFSLLLAWLLARKSPIPEGSPPPYLPKEELREAVWKAVPFGLELMATDILVLLNGYVMLVILRTLNGDFAEIGYFTRGLRLATIAVLAVQSLQRLLYANWAKLDTEQRNRSVENVVNFSIMVMVPVAIVVIIAARPLTIFLFGREFLPAVGVTRVVLLGTCAYLVAQLLQSLFNAAGKTRYNLLVLAVGLGCNLLGGGLLVPRYGAIGAGWTVLGSYVIMTTIAIYLGKIRFNLNLRALLIPRPTLLKHLFRLFKRKEN